VSTFVPSGIGSTFTDVPLEVQVPAMAAGDNCVTSTGLPAAVIVAAVPRPKAAAATNTSSRFIPSPLHSIFELRSPFGLSRTAAAEIG
jgi:hypothetical protein